MPAFHAFDGTKLAYHVQGEGAPLVCVPGGRCAILSTSVTSAAWPLCGG